MTIIYNPSTGEVKTDTSKLYFLGIDPGYTNGALCVLSEELNECYFHDIGSSLSDMCQFFLTWGPNIKYAILEKVHSSPMMGVASAFNFGKGVGWVEALLSNYYIPYETLQPVKWQALCGDRPTKTEVPYDANQTKRNSIRAKDKKESKKATYDWCKRRFPFAELRSFSKDSNRADALGLAFYAWNEGRGVK